MSMMPTDRNRRHDELLRRVGIPGQTREEQERTAGKESDPLSLMRSLLPPTVIPAPPKVEAPRKRR